MECGSRAAAFLVSDLFSQPLQREACRFDPMPRTLNHTRQLKSQRTTVAFRYALNYSLQPIPESL